MLVLFPFISSAPTRSQKELLIRYLEGLEGEKNGESTFATLILWTKENEDADKKLKGADYTATQTAL